MRKVFLYLAVAGVVLVYPFVSAAKTAQLPVTMEVGDTREPPDGSGEPAEPPGEEEPGPPGDEDKEPVYYRVSVAVSGEGSAEADRDRAQAGERVTVTARAADGWQFVRFEGCGEDGTFLMPESDVAVTAFFEKSAPQETPGPGPGSPEPPGEGGPGEPGQDPEPAEGEPVPEPDPDLDPEGNPGDGDPGDGMGEPGKLEEPEEPKPEGLGDGEKPGGPKEPGIRKWVPVAAAGAAVTGAGGGAWYFFIFWKRRKFHGIFAEERIPGTKEWGERNLERRESWFIPELAARLNIGEITWEGYTDTLLHCGAGTKFPGDTYMTIIPAGGDAVRERASEKDLFKMLSGMAGETRVRFTSRRTGMDFVVEYVFPRE